MEEPERIIHAPVKKLFTIRECPREIVANEKHNGSRQREQENTTGRDHVKKSGGTEGLKRTRPIGNLLRALGAP